MHCADAFFLSVTVAVVALSFAENGANQTMHIKSQVPSSVQGEGPHWRHQRQHLDGQRALPAQLPNNVDDGWWMDAVARPAITSAEMARAYSAVRHHVCTMPLPPTKIAPLGTQALNDYLTLEARIQKHQKVPDPSAVELSWWFACLQAGAFFRFTPKRTRLLQHDAALKSKVEALAYDLDDPVSGQLWYTCVELLLCASRLDVL
jgi:hypothetical protein